MYMSMHMYMYMIDYDVYVCNYVYVCIDCRVDTDYNRLYVYPRDTLYLCAYI